MLVGSNVKHLEEIHAAGLEMPVVNEIEVRKRLIGLQPRSPDAFLSCTHSTSRNLSSITAQRTISSSRLTALSYEAPSITRSFRRFPKRFSFLDVRLTPCETDHCPQVGKSPSQTLVRWSLQRGCVHLAPANSNWSDFPNVALSRSRSQPTRNVLLITRKSSTSTCLGTIWPLLTGLTRAMLARSRGILFIRTKTCRSFRDPIYCLSL